MTFTEITEKNKVNYNKVVTHPLQSYEWGEFRKKTNTTVIRYGVEKNGKLIDGFTLTLHTIPKTNYTIGYLPKGNNPTREILEKLREIGKKHNCIFIQLEPNIKKGNSKIISHKNLVKSHRPLFTKYTFEIDLTKDEEILLKKFSSKTRYNIRLAKRKGVIVHEDNSETAFKKYLELTQETTKRQNFYAHTPTYHKKMWETLSRSTRANTLSTHLLTAEFEEEILTTWMLFVFNDALYYPYGASTTKYKNLMASNLVMWEAIRFGKKLGLKTFDLWGALSPDADSRDPWFGFHKFKLGYNPEHIEFVGSYNLIINPTIYKIYKIADRFRWIYLKLKAKFS